MINFEYLSNSRITELRAIQNRKQRQKKGLTFVEGVKAVEEVCSVPDNIRYVILNENSTFELELAQKFYEDLEISCFLLNEDVFKEVTQTKTPQNIIAVVNSPVNIELQKVFDDKPARILVFDRIQDAGNLGTLVRSAAAFGIDYIISIKGTVEITNPKVVRSTAGLLWKMKFSFDNLIEDLIDQLNFNEFQVLIADKVGKPYKNFEPEEPFALILSNEGNGLSAEFREFYENFVLAKQNLDPAKLKDSSKVVVKSPSNWQKITIPQSVKAESLNVGVAGSIILSHFSDVK